MCGLQHAALRHAALHVSGQHTVWQRMDISTERIRRMGSGVKSGFAMLQIEILNNEGRIEFAIRTFLSHRGRVGVAQSKSAIAVRMRCLEVCYKISARHGFNDDACDFWRAL